MRTVQRPSCSHEMPWIMCPRQWKRWAGKSDLTLGQILIHVRKSMSMQLSHHLCSDSLGQMYPNDSRVWVVWWVFTSQKGPRHISRSMSKEEEGCLGLSKGTMMLEGWVWSWGGIGWLSPQCTFPRPTTAPQTWEASPTLPAHGFLVALTPSSVTGQSCLSAC
jgi:hypothetical protein